MHKPSFSRSLRWFLGELLVVVTGVLIAIGLNSWWEGRQHEQTAQNNIRKLISELRIEAAFLEKQEVKALDVQAAAATLLREYQRPGDVAVDSVLDQSTRAANLGIAPGLELGTARLVASGEADVGNDSLRSEVQRLIDEADRIGASYRSEYSAYEHYGDLLRERISYTERLHQSLRSDSSGRTAGLYGGVLPFNRTDPLRFTLDLRAFFNDRATFTIIDGLYDTGSDLAIMVKTMQTSVADALKVAENALHN